jgi:hypothetical protein
MREDGRQATDSGSTARSTLLLPFGDGVFSPGGGMGRETAPPGHGFGKTITKGCSGTYLLITIPYRL